MTFLFHLPFLGSASFESAFFHYICLLLILTDAILLPLIFSPVLIRYFRSMNAQISLADFKFIFYMEWAHRNLGRLIGVSFVLPAIYFAARGRLSKRDKVKVVALAGGIGFQVRQRSSSLSFACRSRGMLSI